MEFGILARLWCLLLFTAAAETFGQERHLQMRSTHRKRAIAYPISMEQRMDRLDQKLSFDMALLKQDLLTEKQKRIELEMKLLELQRTNIVTSQSSSKDIDQFTPVDSNDSAQPCDNSDTNEVQKLMSAFVIGKNRRKMTERSVDELRSAVGEISTQLSEFKQTVDNQTISCTRSPCDLRVQRDISRIDDSFDDQARTLESIGNVYQSLSAAVKSNAAAVEQVTQLNSRTHRVESDIQTIHTDIKEIGQLQQTVETIHGQLAEVKQKYTELEQHNSNDKIAFSAKVKTKYADIAPWETVLFAGVIFNDGGAYSPTTGEFVAPVAGVYVFYAHLTTLFDRVLEAALMVNGNTNMLLYSRVTDGNMVIVTLNVGDVVKVVKHGPWGSKPFYIHHAWSTFSGFRLYGSQ